MAPIKEWRTTFNLVSRRKNHTEATWLALSFCHRLHKKTALMCPLQPFRGMNGTGHRLALCGASWPVVCVCLLAAPSVCHHANKAGSRSVFFRADLRLQPKYKSYELYVIAQDILHYSFGRWFLHRTSSFFCCCHFNNSGWRQKLIHNSFMTWSSTFFKWTFCFICWKDGTLTFSHLNCVNFSLLSLPFCSLFSAIPILDSETSQLLLPEQ